MVETSAGILLYRRAPELEVFLGHMGGPYWEKKDAAAWSIPKGLYREPESAIAAARREFAEEIGMDAPDLDYRDLGVFRLPSGKRLTVFAAETAGTAGTAGTASTADTVETADIAFVRSGTFDLEWPPRSGRVRQFPELDRAEWLPLEIARTKIVRGQLPVLDAIAG